MNLSKLDREILAVVADAGEAYGLEVSERLRRAGLSLHPRLRGLERLGLLATRETEPMPERGGRPRIYYRLTEKGRQQLDVVGKEVASPK